MSSNTHYSWASTLGQLRSCAGVFVLALVQGTAIGWSSPGLAKLAGGKGPFVPTPNEQSWIVSLFDLGCGLGVVTAAAIFSQVGRRLTLLLGPALFTAWSLLTFFAESAPHLMAARTLAGAGQGMCMSYSYIYVGEVATPGIRGALILTVALLVPVGQLLAYTLGPSLTYWGHALMPLPGAAVSALLMLFVMDETPYYLAMRGRHDELVRVLSRLRGPWGPWGRERRGEPAAEAVRCEAAAVREAVERQQRDAASWAATLRPPGAKRAAFIVLVLSGSLALAGVTTVLAYTQQIFERAGTPVPADVSAAALIAIKVAMVIVSMVAIERLGRRLQLGLAALVNVAAMAALASFFLARDALGADVSSWQWLPLTSLVIFIAAAGVGVNAVPQVLMSELLSQRAKAVVAPVAIVIVSLTSFGLNNAFIKVGELYGFHLPFYLYALTNLLIAIFTFFVVPETKGKSLGEVQEMLRSAGKGGALWSQADVPKARNTLGHTYVFKAVKPTSLGAEDIEEP